MPSVEIQVNAPNSFKGAGALSRSHLIYPIIIKTESGSHAASRRYTDFEVFRIRLVSAHWYLIVPPLPEKEGVLENLGISDVPHYQEKVGESRRQEFYQFLKDVYEHPVLRKNGLLLKFMVDEDWRTVIREPFSAPAFLDQNSISSIAQSWLKGKRASFQQDQTSKDHAAIDVQRQHIDSLRKHFQTAICYRKESALALKEFGEEFGSLSKSETDETSQQVISSIHTATEAVAKQKEDRSTQEEELLATLNYWYNMCGSVLETMDNVASAHTYFDQLVQKIEATKNSPSKANSDLLTVENLRKMETEREFLTPILKDADASYKSQLRLFQEEMSKRLNEFLVDYNAIQQKHTGLILHTAQEAGVSGFDA